MAKKILVTGSAGFIGYHLSKRLCSQTDIEVFGIDNFSRYQPDVLYKNLIAVKALDNGQVIIRIDHLIPANKRGVLLLDLESLLKKTMDLGITVWCEPVGDKSKLRQLRGVTINTK